MVSWYCPRALPIGYSKYSLSGLRYRLALLCSKAVNAWRSKGRRALLPGSLFTEGEGLSKRRVRRCPTPHAEMPIAAAGDCHCRTRRFGGLPEAQKKPPADLFRRGLE